jgi:hypothetical protein
MKRLFLPLAIFSIIACSPSKKSTNTQTRGSSYKNEVNSAGSFVVEEVATDNSYAYTKENPAKVGSRTDGGPKNERKFLNALAGPNNEAIKYYRTGSCCPFKTPNAMIGDQGLLDRYKVFWEGCQDTLVVYINMYDEDKLQIPVGLQAKK